MHSPPAVIWEEGSEVFNFQYRRNEFTHPWGLRFKQFGSHDTELVIEELTENGALAAWNRSCEAGPCATKALRPGDAILRVNDESLCQDMIAEMQGKLLLKFSVRRGCLENYDLPSACDWACSPLESIGWDTDPAPPLQPGFAAVSMSPE